MENEDRDSDYLFGEGVNPTGRRSPPNINLLENLDDFGQDFNYPNIRGMLQGMSEDNIDINKEILGTLMIY